MKDPSRTIRIAGPLGIAVVTVLYMLANVAYFAGASKEEITHSGRLVAALLFRNVYGVNAERILSAFIALCAIGNVLSVVCGDIAPLLTTLIPGARYFLKAGSTKSSVEKVYYPSVNSGHQTVHLTLLGLASVCVRNLLFLLQMLYLSFHRLDHVCHRHRQSSTRRRVSLCDQRSM